MSCIDWTHYIWGSSCVQAHSLQWGLHRKTPSRKLQPKDTTTEDFLMGFEEHLIGS